MGHEVPGDNPSSVGAGESLQERLPEAQGESVLATWHQCRLHVSRIRPTATKSKADQIWSAYELIRPAEVCPGPVDQPRSTQEKKSSEQALCNVKLHSTRVATFGMFCRNRNLTSYVKPKTHLYKIRIIFMSGISTLLSCNYDQVFTLAILSCIDNILNVSSLTDEDGHSH